MKEKKEVVEVVLDLDYAFGPIWGEYLDPVQIKLYTGIDAIDKNAEIMALNDKICDLYSDFYDPELNYDINQEYAKSKKDELLSMIDQLIDMLYEVNDGSFVIVNKIKLNF